MFNYIFTFMRIVFKILHIGLSHIIRVPNMYAIGLRTGCRNQLFFFQRLTWSTERSHFSRVTNNIHLFVKMRNFVRMDTIVKIMEISVELIRLMWNIHFGNSNNIVRIVFVFLQNIKDILSRVILMSFSRKKGTKIYWEITEIFEAKI